MTTAIAEPAYTGSLKKRKALTKDILKLTRHELEKEFKDRVHNAHVAREAFWIEVFDQVDAYDAITEKMIDEAIQVVGEKCSGAFDMINLVNVDDSKGLEMKIDPGTHGYYGKLHAHPKPASYHEDAVFHGGDESLFACIRQLKKEGDMSKSVTRSVEIDIYEYDEDEEDPQVSFAITIEMKATEALIAARQQLIPTVEIAATLKEALDNAEEDLVNLDKNVKELEMQAVAKRVGDAGGGVLLDDVLGSMNSLLKGEKLNGLQAALPVHSDNKKDGDG